jgi:hypothetical protein
MDRAAVSSQSARPRLARPLRWAAGAALAAAAWTAGAGLWSESRAPLTLRPSGPQRIAGRVVSAGRPVAGAVVRVKGMATSTTTDAQGRFALACLRMGPLRVTAARDDLLIGGTDWPSRGPLAIDLAPRPAADDPRYAWVSSFPSADEEGRCGNCHRAIYDEWAASAHAASAANERFWNVVDGDDWHGRPHVAWDLSAEYPEGRGVCFSCHVPSAAPEAALMDLARPVAGVDGEGVHCDLCHKVAEVAERYRPAGRSQPSEPRGLNHGRFGLALVRPPPGEQLFFGPLDDVDRGEDVALPLYRQSRYCASCHEGTLFGTPAYTTYSEWLASPAARQGKQCQDCHMAPTGRMTNFAPGRGGIERDPATLASHHLPGSDPQFVRRHVVLSADVREDTEEVVVDTTVLARNVGHRVPTGHPSRHLLLWVRAEDAAGRPLERVEGPVLNGWAGEGRGAGRLAGEPGTAYAKVLADREGTEQVPMWRPNEVVRDTRLFPDRPDRQQFRFRRPNGPAIVRVQLLYRRFPQPLAVAKDWPDNEFILSTVEQQIGE